MFVVLATSLGAASKNTAFLGYYVGTDKETWLKTVRWVAGTGGPKVVSQQLLPGVGRTAFVAAVEFFRLQQSPPSS